MRITHALLAPFEIEADNDQYTLLKTGVVKTGKNEGQKSESPIGYYTTLDSALRTVVRQQILSGNEALDLDAYVKMTCKKMGEFQELKLA